MKRYTVLVAVSILSLALNFAACGGGGGGGGGGGPTTSLVTGTVLDSDNQPIEGATVAIASVPVFAVTDAAGAFSATVTEGAHTLSVVKDGYTLVDLLPISVASGSSALPTVTPDSQTTYFVDGALWHQDLDGDGFAYASTLFQCGRPEGYRLTEELLSTNALDMDDNHATALSGRALLGLDGTKEILLVDLADMSVLDTALTSAGTDCVLVDPAGPKGYIVDYSMRTVDEYDLSSDIFVFSQQMSSAFTSLGNMFPWQADISNGTLGIVSGYDDFIAWSPGTSGISYNAMGTAYYFWDIAAAASSVLFIAPDYSENTVFVLDGNAAIISTLVYSNPASAIPSTASGPLMAALSPDDTRLYLANFVSNDLLAFAFNAGSGAASFIRSVPLEDAERTATLYYSVGMVVSPDGNTVWLAADDSGDVVAFDTAAESAPVTVIPLPPFAATVQPGELALSADGTHLLVAGSTPDGSYGTDFVYVLDAAAKTVVLAIDTLAMSSISSPGGTPTRPVAIAVY